MDLIACLFCACCCACFQTGVIAATRLWAKKASEQGSPKGVFIACCCPGRQKKTSSTCSTSPSPASPTTSGHAALPQISPLQRVTGCFPSVLSNGLCRLCCSATSHLQTSSCSINALLAVTFGSDKVSCPASAGAPAVSVFVYPHTFVDLPVCREMLWMEAAHEATVVSQSLAELCRCLFQKCMFCLLRNSLR